MDVKFLRRVLLLLVLCAIKLTRKFNLLGKDDIFFCASCSKWWFEVRMKNSIPHRLIFFIALSAKTNTLYCILQSKKLTMVFFSYS